MTTLSRREEIASRLACAMLGCDDPMLMTTANKLPEICVTVASEIMLMCKELETEDSDGTCNQADLAACTTWQLLEEINTRGVSFVVNIRGSMVTPPQDGSPGLSLSVETPEARESVLTELRKTRS